MFCISRKHGTVDLDEVQFLCFLYFPLVSGMGFYIFVLSETGMCKVIQGFVWNCFIYIIASCNLIPCTVSLVCLAMIVEVAKNSITKSIKENYYFYHFQIIPQKKGF